MKAANHEMDRPVKRRLSGLGRGRDGIVDHGHGAEPVLFEAMGQGAEGGNALQDAVDRAAYCQGNLSGQKCIVEIVGAAQP